MGRLGLPCDRIRPLAEQLDRQVTGIFSTLACSDSDPEFTALQIDRFRQAGDGIPVLRHLANSAALTCSGALMDAVRPGLALYGIATVPGLADLQPVMTWKARVIAVNELPVGATVGYGATWRADRASRIGVIGVGYADGYRRDLSRGASVGTAHGAAPVVGRISMDLTAIDVTDLPAIQPGAEVTLLDADAGSPRSAAGLARRLGTIPYDILATVGPRVLRIYRE
jgi:alanine racemase